jgi:hypothetical protein
MGELIVGHRASFGGAPALILQHRTESLESGKHFALKPQRQLWCTGSTPPGNKRVACLNGLPAKSGAQCEQCKELSQLAACLRCTGQRCLNPARRADCADQPHLVYLADFGGVLKVGVCRSERFEERLLEQGAYAGLEVLRAGGLEVRRVERLVCEHGIVDRVSLPGLLSREPLTREQSRELLQSELSRLAHRMPDLGWYPAGRNFFLENRYPAAREAKMVDPSRDVVGGTILGTRGGLLLAVDGQGSVNACAMRSLHGRMMEKVAAESAGPSQLHFV